MFQYAKILLEKDHDIPLYPILTTRLYIHWLFLYDKTPHKIVYIII